MHNFYDDLGELQPLVTPKRLHDLIGNFFKPSALLASLGEGNGTSLSTLLSGDERNLMFPKPIPPAALHEAYALLREKVITSARAGGLDGKVLQKVTKQIQQLPCPFGKYDDAWLHAVIHSPVFQC